MQMSFKNEMLNVKSKNFCKNRTMIIDDYKGFKNTQKIRYLEKVTISKKNINRAVQ